MTSVRGWRRRCRSRRRDDRVADGRLDAARCLGLVLAKRRQPLQDSSRTRPPPRPDHAPRAVERLGWRARPPRTRSLLDVLPTWIRICGSSGSPTETRTYRAPWSAESRVDERGELAGKDDPVLRRDPAERQRRSTAPLLLLLDRDRNVPRPRWSAASGPPVSIPLVSSSRPETWPGNGMSAWAKPCFEFGVGSECQAKRGRSLRRIFRIELRLRTPKPSVSPPLPPQLRTPNLRFLLPSVACGDFSTDVRPAAALRRPSSRRDHPPDRLNADPAAVSPWPRPCGGATRPSSSARRIPPPRSACRHWGQPTARQNRTGPGTPSSPSSFRRSGDAS
jgi:hypothetical protein